MKNFKKLISLILVVSMVAAAFSGCGNKKKKTPTPEPSGNVTGTPSDISGTPSGNISGTPSGDISGTPVTGTPANPTGGPGIINTNGSGSKTGNFELTGTKKVPADGIGTPGVDFEIPTTGEVTGWSDEELANMPAFNPLGDRSLYNYFNVNDYYSSFTFEYYAEDGYTPCELRVDGLRFDLCTQDMTITKNWLLYKAKELGADYIYNTDSNYAIFTYIDSKSVAWFVSCEILQGYEIRIVEMAVPLLTVGSEIKLSDDSLQYYENKFVFCTRKTPGKQQGAALRFEGTSDDIYDGFGVEYNAAFRQGEYDYSVSHSFESYGWRLGPRTGEKIVLDNIAAEPEWVFWEINNEYYKGNYNAYISLQEIGTRQEITIGEQPGLVKIIGAGADFGAKCTTEAYIRVANAETRSLEGGYQDDQGNYCFVAPAGYYELEIGNHAVSDFEYYIQNVPVSSGKITEVTLPAETKTYASDLLQIGRSNDVEVGNMDIRYVVDNGDTVTLGILVHDPEERDLFPENKDFTITENGVQGEVISIDRQAAGTNVIMCVDTSGSIKGSIAKVIESAVKFVESLPDNTNISIIEFKGKLTEHKGNTKTEAITALKSMTASGYTKLYDAVSLAIDRLEGKKNAYVIAFTDGIDNREPEDYNPSQGSVMSKEELYDKIEASSVTVLSMGFGSKHIAEIMTNMAEASRGGQYYYVADDKALDGAFAQVRSKFGNQFTVTYKRPVITENQASDVPVVSIMMDVSRSMNLLPEEEEGDVDIRLERVRSLFHDFILNLPDTTIGQFASFTSWYMGDTLIRTRQVLTRDKADLLKALSKEKVEGGTPIQKALEISYNSLRNVSSSKKVLVFFTDAALQVSDDGSGAQQQEFDKILDKIKKAGIRVLFAGLGGAEYAASYDEVFKYAAEKAGGDYIIGTTVEEIETKLNELLAKIDQPIATEKGVSIYAALSCKAEDGSTVDYATSHMAEDLVIKKQQGEVKTPGVVSKKIAGDYITYSGETSALLYGSDTKEETVIDSRITFTDAKTSNQFADLTVSEAYIMPKFKGVEVKYLEFLALNVTLTFHKKDTSAKEEGYQIPNIFNHFYVSLNNGRMMPASEATWLAETPFAIPGENSVQVNELKDAKGNKLEIGESISGILIFLVEEENTWDQLSIHCYDTSYGHLEIPLVGALPDSLMNITNLPTEAPANIAESFNLKLTGCEDTREIAGATISEEYLSDRATYETFRVLEMEFESKVQALLDINPVERFYYSIQTDSGYLLTRMSDIVYNLPLGFTGGTKFAPGSVTKVRLPFVLPLQMLECKATLWGEIKGGSFEMAVNSGKAWTGGSDNVRFEHEYFTLVINKFAYLNDNKERVILDFTVIDKEDGEGTGGFDTMLYLFRNTDEYADVNDISGSGNGGTMINAMERKGLGNFGDMSRLMEPAGIKMANLDATRELVFGASMEDADWGAYDGQSRRGVLIFDVPDDEHKSDWRLTSECLPDLSLKISDKYFGDSPLLTKKARCEYDSNAQEELNRRIDVAVAAYRATHPASGTTEKVGLTDDEIIGNHIEAPYLTIYGTQVIESVKSLNDVYKLLQSLVWLPGDMDSIYSPEAVITQGYGFDSDFYNLANYLFMKIGYKTTAKRLDLTEAGKENLARFCGVEPDEIKNYWVYGINYTDEKGNSRLYVPAFRHYMEDLSGLAALNYEKPYLPTAKEGRIIVRAYGDLTGNACMAAQNLLLTQFADIFGGGDGEISYYEDVVLLDETFNLREIGKNPIDVSFISLGKDSDGVHEKITAVADTAEGLLKSGERWVSTADYKFDRIEVEITGWGDSVIHTYLLEEDDDLLDVFMSLGVNLPELTTEAAKAYEKAVNESVKAFENTEKTNYGICRWTTHAAIAKMQRQLTEYNAEAANHLGVISIPDMRKLNVLCATLKADGDNAICSFDLTNISRDIILLKETAEEGKGHGELLDSYTLVVSMMASQGERDAFANGVSYIDVWATLPSDAAIINIDANEDERMKALELFRELGAAPYLLERLEKAPGDIAFVTATAPGKINGKDRWVWLEINTNSMETISVFDTGERGMAAYIVGLTPKGLAEFTVGAFIGVACANVSVAAYALESDNYEYVMKSARALMGYTLDNLRAFRGAISDIQSAAEDPGKYLDGKIGGQIDDGINSAVGADIMKWYHAFRENDPSGLGKEPDFCDGFEAAMKMYFGEQLDWGF